MSGSDDLPRLLRAVLDGPADKDALEALGRELSRLGYVPDPCRMQCRRQRIRPRLPERVSTERVLHAVPMPFSVLRDPVFNFEDAGSQSLRALYDAARRQVSRLEDYGEEHWQVVLLDELNRVPDNVRDAFLAALADEEIRLSEAVCNRVYLYLYSENSSVVSSATQCLLMCGGDYGSWLLDIALGHPNMLPCVSAVLGIRRIHRS